VLDLLSLSALVYITGGIETPIFMFYIFHMIIGAIILPASIIYSIAGILIFVFSLLSFLEYAGIIVHQSIKGLYPFSFYNELNFVIAFVLFFSSVLIISIFLTHKIASDLYNRERQLKFALDEIEEAEASKQKYIIAVVHELKSPIAAATSFLDIILGGFVGEINDAVKDKLIKTKSRVVESIENINSILRVSKYKLLNKIEFENISLHNIIQSNIDKTKIIADRNNIQIKFIDNSIEDNFLSGDNVLLNLAFSNLIGNAVKYTPHGGKVNISIDQSLDHYIVSISDTGIGIPRDEHEKIFEEYYRASNTSNKAIEGTGTGLAVVKQVINSHNGQITLKSPSLIGNRENPGTTFIVSLPYSK
jgi:signal transduction histidine kinase